jgi:hypothetical protein
LWIGLLAAVLAAETPVKTPPIPEAGPLTQPKPLDQVGFPAELTRQAIPPDNPQTPEKIALGEKLFRPLSDHQERGRHCRLQEAGDMQCAGDGPDSFSAKKLYGLIMVIDHDMDILLVEGPVMHARQLVANSLMLGIESFRRFDTQRGSDPRQLGIRRGVVPHHPPGEALDLGIL